MNNKGVHITSRGPYIVTYTGHRFHPEDVRKSDIHIEDIAHALSNQCRFAGHVNEFYSVAQHCVHVAHYLGILNPEEQLRGLLHDASEAYLVDVPRPIKHMPSFSVYRRIEKETTRAIYERFGIIGEDPECIHDMDNMLLATEAHDLMDNPYWAHTMPKLPIKIEPWLPKRAESEFLKAFSLYTTE